MSTSEQTPEAVFEVALSRLHKISENVRQHPEGEHEPGTSHLIAYSTTASNMLIGFYRALNKLAPTDQKKKKLTGLFVQRVRDDWYSWLQENTNIHRKAILNCMWVIENVCARSALSLAEMTAHAHFPLADFLPITKVLFADIVKQYLDSD